MTIRDRIVAALQSLTGPGSSGDLSYGGMADVVIQELGLRQETAHAWRGNSSYVTGIRYVTDWEPPV